jgi:hypothetical protein
MAKRCTSGFHRPSVRIWGYLNEIFLRSPIPKVNSWKIIPFHGKKVARAWRRPIREEDLQIYDDGFHNMLNIRRRSISPKSDDSGMEIVSRLYETDINEFQRCA